MLIGVGVCELIRLVVRRSELGHVAGVIVVIAFVAACVVLCAYEVAVIVVGVALISSYGLPYFKHSAFSRL